MNLELVSEWFKTEWPSIVVVSVATLIITLVTLFHSRAKDLDATEDNTEEEDFEEVMKYWGPDVTSVSYEVRSVMLTRNTPSSSTDKHPTSEGTRSSRNPSEDQPAKEPVENDKENVPETDLKNDKEPMKEDGDHPASQMANQDSPAKEDGDRPTSDKDFRTDHPSSSEKSTPLKCDPENVLNAKVGELYNDEKKKYKWRVLQRKNVKSTFTIKNWKLIKQMLTSTVYIKCTHYLVK